MADEEGKPRRSLFRRKSTKKTSPGNSATDVSNPEQPNGPVNALDQGQGDIIDPERKSDSEQAPKIQDQPKEQKPFFRSLLSSVMSPSFMSPKTNPKKEDASELLVEDEVEDGNPEAASESLIVSRYEKAHSRATSAGSNDSMIYASNWLKDLQNTYQQAKTTILSNLSEQEDGIVDDKPDWDFWGIVINDYERVIRTNPRQFQRNLEKGIPQPIRGMMWQLMCGSKNEELEQLYSGLLLRKSRHEKIIQRDLPRTFPNHEFFKDAQGPGQQSLFNILKCYSLHDQEVGYCQGLPFIVGPLLMNMPEEQAFCVLVKLMDEYSFRSMFTPKMIGLQIRNYQFDKLVREYVPVVDKHLQDQDIKSTMYASQWFMTLFAYRFPLELVFRIYDIILAQGEDSVLRFAVALIKANQDHIITLEFEELVDYLKDGLFDKYVENIIQLINDASKVYINPKKLKKWETEYLEQIRKQEPDYIECERLKEENRRLRASLVDQERIYEELHKEHISLLNKYTVDKQDLEHEVEKNQQLMQQVESLKAILQTERQDLEKEFTSEIDYLKQKLEDSEKQKLDLQDNCGTLEEKLIESRNEQAKLQNECIELKHKMNI